MRLVRRKRVVNGIDARAHAQLMLVRRRRRPSTVLHLCEKRDKVNQRMTSAVGLRRVESLTDVWWPLVERHLPPFLLRLLLAAPAATRQTRD